MDSGLSNPYLVFMTRLSGILIAVLITLLAGWSVVQVSATTTMLLEMPAADDRAMDMADCEACASGAMEEQAHLLCGVACVSPVLADLSATHEVTWAPVVALYTPGLIAVPAGRTYPPDPYPPRTALLI